jgi:hypothetical protein
MMKSFHSIFMFCRKVRTTVARLHCERAMTRRVFLHFVLWALAAFLFTTHQAAGKKSGITGVAGPYNIIVRGHWSGQGTATVTPGMVAITATVSDDSGQTGLLIATGLPLTNQQFSGPGVVLGVPMTIEGRVDAQDPPAGKGKGKGKGKGNAGPVLIDSRIGATFNAGGHRGRIAGSEF